MLTQFQQEIQTKIKSGNCSFSQLSDAEKTELAQLIRAKNQPFSQEQRNLLSSVYLIIPNDVNINALNEGQRHRINAIQTIHGYYVTPAKLLTNIRAKEPYHWAAEYLVSWTFVELGKNDFLVSELPD